MNSPTITRFENKESQNKDSQNKEIPRSWIVQILCVIALLSIVVISRIMLADLANFKPVAAIGLFAGFVLCRRYLGLMIVLTGMLISDCFLGSYSWPIAVSVYGCLMVPVFMGNRLSQLQQKTSVGFMARWLGSVLGGSILFFVVTNMAVWLFSGLYMLDVAGLIECLVNAIPFFRNTLVSDLSFSILLFGGYGMVSVGLKSAVRSRRVGVELIGESCRS